MIQTFSQPAAEAKLSGGIAAPLLKGTVRFYQKPGGVLVVAEVSGLPRKDGFYGFHIHEGSCTGIDFGDTLGHYDPAGQSHPLHAGDLPPLLGCNGRAYMAVLTDRFSLQEVQNRTVVIHGEADDFRSQPAGNAGMKIACGVIMPYRRRR